MSDIDLPTIDWKAFHRKGRYLVTGKGYVIDRNIFRIYSIVLMSIALILLASDMVDGTELKAYVSCPEDAIGGGCSNPIYGRCDLPACQKENLFPGESIGTPYDGSIEKFFISSLVVLALLFFVNHIFQKTEAYNRARNSYKKC